MKKLLVILILILISVVVYAPEQNPEDKAILLKSRTFMPAKGIDPTLNIQSLPARPHLFIQFGHIPTAEEREELNKLNVNLDNYLPYNTWIVSPDKIKISDIKKLPFVRYIGPILPEDKITSQLKEKVPEYATNPDGTVNLIVVFFKDVSQKDAEDLLEKLGTISYKGPFMLNDYTITTSKNSISALANENLVQWIEPVPPPTQDLNDDARNEIGVNEVQAAPYNLSGNGVRVGMWENTNPDTTQDDLKNRITIVENVGVNNHSTHVAGTLGGNGSLRSDLLYRGVATNVTIYSYSTENGYPEDHNGAINTYNIDLSQNSWGQYIFGNYTTTTIKYDNIVRGIYGKKIPIIFAAGNNQSSIPDGFNSILAPGATAKNTITVGATHLNAFYISKIANFSSFGPTDDGRIKPDVIAPGCQRVGSASAPGASIWSTVSPNTYYGMCGTSSSAPFVSGTIALMWEQFRKGSRTELVPLPSTFKAILIHTAVDLNETGPDFRSGYGKINTTASINTIINSSNTILEGNVSTNETDIYVMYVPLGTPNLKVTLVWDDVPGTPGAQIELVNDLDLILISPSGTIYYPYILDPINPANPATNGIDRLNNIEQVNVISPEQGEWKINITGYSIPTPIQDYSLVYKSEQPQEIYCFGIISTDPSVCSGHGACVAQDTCICQDGYFGLQCNSWNCFGILDNNPLVCSGHGTCVSPETCNCNQGWLGENCSIIDTKIDIKQGWNLLSPILTPTDENTNRTILLKKGWNMFGYSSTKPFLWENAIVSNGTNMTNITKAANEGWLQSTIYYYDGAQYRFTPGDDNYLQKNRGYWLYALQDNLMLTLPNAGGSYLDNSFDWMKANVSNSTDIKTITEAQSLGWLQGTIYYFDEDSQYYKFIPGDNDFIEPWRGYWLYSNRNLSLIIS